MDYLFLKSDYGDWTLFNELEIDFSLFYLPLRPSCGGGWGRKTKKVTKNRSLTDTNCVQCAKSEEKCDFLFFYRTGFVCIKNIRSMKNNIENIFFVISLEII
jgi:hypothetical protein